MRHELLQRNLSNNVKLLSRAQYNLYTQFSMFVDLEIENTVFDYKPTAHMNFFLLN